MEENRPLPSRAIKQHISVKLPASVKIATSAATMPIEMKEATILDIVRTASGLMLAVELPVSREDLRKLFVRRRTCYIFCRLPDSEKPTPLFGTIFWVEPRMTSRGTLIRFGVTITESNPEHLSDLMAYLEKAAGNQ